MTPSIYRPAHEGRNGPFVKWLEDLGLKDFLRSFPLSKLAEWRWIDPIARIHVDQFFFEELEQKRQHPTSRPSTELEILWGPIWSIDDTESIHWCIDPLLIQGSSLCERINAGHNQTTTTPKPYIGENGVERHPYVDYYLHWQGYALIDTIIWSDNGALLRTPDVAERLERLIPHLAENNLDARSIAYSASRWAGVRATHFTWISHYRSTRSALDWYALRVPQKDKREFLSNGARTLSQFLEISHEDLHVALKNSFLVVAQEWRSRRESSKSQWVTNAWKELQKDVYNCVEWLCLLEDKSINYYLEEYRHEHFGNLEWAQLYKVLDFGHFKSAIFFSTHARKYVEKALPELQARIPEEPIKVRCLAYKIIEACPPFEDFMESFRAIHDDLRAHSDKPQLDLRHRRPVDHFATFAIRAETCLRYALLESDRGNNEVKSSIDTLSKYIEHIVVACRGTFPSTQPHSKQEFWGKTQLKSSREEKISDVMNLNFIGINNLQATELRGFLGCVLARNYFAHHYDLDYEMVKGATGQFIMASITFTVWQLLTEYLEIT